MKISAQSLFLLLFLSCLMLFPCCSDDAPGSSDRLRPMRENILSVDTFSPDSVFEPAAPFSTANASGVSSCGASDSLAFRTVSKYFCNSFSDTLRVGLTELIVASGAMEGAKVLSITPLMKGDLPPLPVGLVNVTGLGSFSPLGSDRVSGYRFLPHGEHFVHHPALVIVPYDADP